MPNANDNASDAPPTSARRERAEDVEKLAHWLDDRFAIPGTKFRFGFDFLIGLIPGIGDGLTALLSFYVVARARAHGASPFLMVRMVWNIVVDAVIGSIPLVGDIFDLSHRANLKNARLLQEHLDRNAQADSGPTQRTQDAAAKKR